MIEISPLLLLRTGCFLFLILCMCGNSSYAQSPQELQATIQDIRKALIELTELAKDQSLRLTEIERKLDEAKGTDGRRPFATVVRPYRECAEMTCGAEAVSFCKNLGYSFGVSNGTRQQGVERQGSRVQVTMLTAAVCTDEKRSGD